MIDRAALLDDLQRLVKLLEDDLRERVGDVPELDARLREEHRLAREAGRTAEAYEQWREEPLTQAAVAWVLATVFVRFMEDNGLLETPRLSGPGERRSLARDHHTVFFQKNPTLSDREYLEDVFREVAALPAAAALFDERHNPLWSLGLSGDGARKLLELWQRIDPETGELVHDFTDPAWSTRFLGDLYQDLSEAARKRYALLQTPEFVEEFILDRTLDPAVEEFGYAAVRLIDPTCGSGHFLLGAFRRLFALHQRNTPGTHSRELAQRALDQVWGVDINPFAVAIARFRLLVAGLRATGIGRLKDAPAFRIHLAAGDSLFHGVRFLRGEQMDISRGQIPLNRAHDTLKHTYHAEDAEALREILGQQYHAVVGNPPYVTVKDEALNATYRGNYGACHRQYSLAVPFMQRFFDLTLAGRDGQPAGFTGMITANSFMKREFGKKLIEEFIPRSDLTHVVDTSGAYIPGHGTPTVILFGRNRAPVAGTVRAVMGIRGEPQTPEDPAKGLVWTAIREQIHDVGSSSDWVSVSDTARSVFHEHPWSLGGGGAAELKELLDERSDRRLGDVAREIGFGAVTREDEAYLVSREVALRHRVGASFIKPLVAGETIRDWGLIEPVEAIWPYDAKSLGATADQGTVRFLWPMRSILAGRTAYGQTQIERGLSWFEYSMFFRDRYSTPLSIAFAEVATHNHFVLDRGGKVFKQTAPVIKLPAAATEDEHLAFLGLLNSSTGCFWLKQVSHCKGGQGINEGAKDEAWEGREA
jgi:hypothetical protein